MNEESLRSKVDMNKQIGWVGSGSVKLTSNLARCTPAYKYDTITYDIF